MICEIIAQERYLQTLNKVYICYISKLIFFYEFIPNTCIKIPNL